VHKRHRQSGVNVIKLFTLTPDGGDKKVEAYISHQHSLLSICNIHVKHEILVVNEATPMVQNFVKPKVLDQEKLCGIL
jgi:hypothetical protein